MVHDEACIYGERIGGLQVCPAEEAFACVGTAGVYAEADVGHVGKAGVLGRGVKCVVAQIGQQPWWQHLLSGGPICAGDCLTQGRA